MRKESGEIVPEQPGIDLANHRNNTLTRLLWILGNSQYAPRRPGAPPL